MAVTTAAGAGARPAQAGRALSAGLAVGGLLLGAWGGGAALWAGLTDLGGACWRGGLTPGGLGAVAWGAGLGAAVVALGAGAWLGACAAALVGRGRRASPDGLAALLAAVAVAAVAALLWPDLLVAPRSRPGAALDGWLALLGCVGAVTAAALVVAGARSQPPETP